MLTFTQRKSENGRKMQTNTTDTTVRRREQIPGSSGGESVVNETRGKTPDNDYHNTGDRQLFVDTTTLSIDEVCGL
jgi:hypothetical protein